MSVTAIQLGLVGLVRLVTLGAVTGWVSSPMSWSPDAQWLSYTVAADPDRGRCERGWLLNLSHADEKRPSLAGESTASGTDGAGAYRIWTSHRDGEPSVLMEESAWPLTAPSWRPRGKAVVFGRFVPDPLEVQRPAPKGRMEVVIQDSLERRRVLFTVPDFELDADARAAFPKAGGAWSPDGHYLAFPKPGRAPSILVIRVDSRKLIQTIDNSVMASWSPDGTKLAFIHQEDEEGHTLQVIERHGQTWTGAHPILEMGKLVAPLTWDDDGRSIFAVVEKSGLRSAEVDIARVFLETGELMKVFPLAPELLRRGTSVRGITLDFDREEEICFFSVDLEGRDADLCWSIPQNRLIFKRFHPLDPKLHIVSLAVSPDGRAVAMRFEESSGVLTLPALYQLPTDRRAERTSLIVPDEAARRSWLGVLARTSRALLEATLPPADQDGRPAARPTLLPLPDEIPAGHPMHSRLSRLGRFGSAICAARPLAGAAEAGQDAGPATLPEARFFFDYIQGNYLAAAADLDAIEPGIDTREGRLVILSLRAQVLWGQGDTSRARAIADYLVEAVGGPVHRFESTPLGPVITPEPDPGRGWARYLAARASQPPATATPPDEPSPGERIDPLFLNPFAPAEPPELIERGRGVGVPFAPPPPGEGPDPARLRFRIGGAGPARPQGPPPPPRPVDARTQRSRPR